MQIVRFSLLWLLNAPFNLGIGFAYLMITITITRTSSYSNGNSLACVKDSHPIKTFDAKFSSQFFAVDY